MILTLNKFKCWDNLTIEIPLNKVTLIKGRSGKGKSTILSAIDWVLYGEYKKVGPKHAPTSKTNVTLKTPDILVTRTKNPNKLLLKYQNVDYEDVNAQTKINDLYGIYEVWLATSYMQQMCQNYFLASPNNTKIDLLNKISFQDQDPNEYISKIDKELDKYKTLHQYQLDEYNKKYVDYQYNINLILTDDNFMIINNKINKLEKEKIKYEKLKIEYDNQQLLLNSKNKELENYQKQLLLLTKPIFTKQFHNHDNDLHNINIDNIKTLHDYVNELKIIENYIKQLNNIKLSKITLPDCHFTLNDLQETLLNEKIYNDNYKLCQQLNIDHDQETVDEYIEHLNEVLSSQPYLEKELELKTLNDKRLLLTQKINDIVLIPTILTDNKDNIISLEKKLNHAQHYYDHLLETKKAIKCPHCDQDVLYKKGELVKITISSTTDVVDEIKLYQNHIKLLSKEIENERMNQKRNDDKYQLEKSKYEKSLLIKNNLQQELNELDNKIMITTSQLNTLEKPEHPLLKPDEKNQIYKVLGQLKNVKIINQPTISSSIIKDFLDKKELYNQQKLLQLQYDDLLKKIPSEYLNKELYIEELEFYLKNSNQYLQQYDFLDKNIDHIKNQINITLIDNPMDDLNNIKNNLLTLNEHIQNHNNTKIIMENHQKLVIEKEEIEKLNHKINYLSTLKKLAIDVECDILKNTVNTINYNIKELSGNMFENEIKIEMNLYKKQKATDKIKQDINFSIIHNGGKYDSILELSVGEMNRASIALTLALNKLSSSPIIIFDEVLRSVEPELKLDMIEIIKQNLSNTIILAEHGYVESAVDHVIDIELLK